MLDVRDDLELANYQLDTVNIFSDSGFWVDKKKGGIRNWRKHISDIAEFGDFCLLQMNGFRQLHVVIWHIFYFLISIKRVIMFACVVYKPIWIYLRNGPDDSSGVFIFHFFSYYAILL
jgi:hypothetical protein